MDRGIPGVDPDPWGAVVNQILHWVVDYVQTPAFLIGWASHAVCMCAGIVIGRRIPRS